MAAWLKRGSEAIHWDLYRRFGRPPVLAPPRWALCERIWESCGLEPGSARGDEEGRGEPGMEGSGEIASAGPEARGDVATSGRGAETARGSRVEPADWVEQLREGVESVGSSAVCLVVPDATRVGAWSDLLPDALSALDGLFAERTLLVATGTHRPADAARLRAHLVADRPEVEERLRRWRIVQNSDEGFRHHVALGTTPAGTPVALHPEYLRAGARVLLGDTSYHYFAGFGGGPKLVFPGCADPEGAARNHRRAVSSGEGGESWRWVATCAPGRTAGNPVLEDIERAYRLAPAAWCLVPVVVPPPDEQLDPSSPLRFPLRVVQGGDTDAFQRARDLHDVHARIRFTQRPDVLVVDAGGEPRDASFLQAQKSLQHARRFVAPGARILLVARCADGLASATLERYVRERARFVPDPSDLHVQTLVSLADVVASHEIALWSDLDPAVVRVLGLEPVESAEAALAWMDRIPGARWGWLPRVERFLPAEGWLGGGAPVD